VEINLPEQAVFLKFSLILAKPEKKCRSWSYNILLPKYGPILDDIDIDKDKMTKINWSHI
jgi:hypothetical protein